MRTPIASLLAFASLFLVAGSAGAQQITVAPTSLDFGGVALGSMATQSVSLNNTGMTAVNLNTIAVTAGGPDFIVSPALVAMLPLTLLPGSNLSVDVTFSPTVTQGKRNGTVTITLSAGNPITVALTGSAGDPMIKLGNNAVIFGNVQVGANSAPQALTISNVGFSNLRVIGVSLTGTNATDFAVTNPQLPATVPPGGMLSYQLSFRPMALGNRAASVTITSDDPVSGAISYSVAGTGVAYDQALAPTSVDFGMLKTNTTSAPRMVTLTNNSKAPLAVSAVSIIGPQAASFVISNPPMLPANVAANGGTLVVSVSYRPQAPSPANALLAVTLADPNVPVLTASLKGVGTAGSVAVSPTSLDFGSSPLGVKSMAKQVTIRNGGTAPLSITSLAFSGGAGAFSLSSPPTLPATVSPNATLVLNVAFTPTTHGMTSAFLNVACDDPLTPSVMVQVKGVGTQGALSVSPPRIDFGITAVNSPTDPAPIGLSNEGDAPLTIDKIGLKGANAAAFRLDSAATPITLEPGEGTTVNVRFDPKAPVVNGTADVEITPSDPLLAPESVRVTGSAATTVLAVMPAEIDFGLVAIGLPSDPVTVTIKNVSPGSITMAPIQVTSAAFLVESSTTATSLAPNASTSFQVIFQPSSEMEAMGRVQVALSAAPTRAIAGVNVRGTGVVAKTPSPSGCALSRRGSPSPWAACALLLGALLLRRRNRVA